MRGGLGAPTGPVPGAADERYAGSDLWALERGIELECSLPGSLDLFPRSEVDGLREVGEVLCVRPGDLPEGATVLYDEARDG